MDDEPRDDLWWVPWHWGRRQWTAAILIGILLMFAGGLWIIVEVLYRLMS